MLKATTTDPRAPVPHRGNWFEEDVLEATTGVRLCPDPRDRQAQLLTKARVIEHTEQENPRDYKSTMSQCITNQLEHPNYKTLQDRVGPRQRLLEAKLKAQVQSEFAQKESSDYESNRRVDYQSDAMANFNKAGFKPSLVLNDATSRLPTYHADYCTDTPVTTWSDSVRRGAANFPSTFVTSGNPFRRSTAFSADIVREPTVRRAESNERPRPPPTVRDYAILRELRARTLEHLRSIDFSGVAGRLMRILVDAIWSLADSESPNASLHVDDLIAGLSASLSLIITTQERSALLAAFDLTSNNTISLPDLTDFFRGSLSPRAMELVNIVVSALSSSQPAFTEGFVSEAAIREMYCGDAVDADNMVASLRPTSDGQVSTDEVFEYYTDIYAELDNNQKFEVMLRKCWGL